VLVLRFTHFVVHSSLLFVHFDVFLLLKLARLKCRLYIKSLILREEHKLRFLSALFKSVTELDGGDVTEKWGTFYVNEECFLNAHRIVRTVGQVCPFFFYYTNKEPHQIYVNNQGCNSAMCR
jgi:hypothetical protein